MHFGITGMEPDWTAGISACHAEASDGVKRLSFDEIEADIGRSGDVQAEMPALQSVGDAGYERRTTNPEPLKTNNDPRTTNCPPTFASDTKSLSCRLVFIVEARSYGRCSGRA